MREAGCPGEGLWGGLGASSDPWAGECSAWGGGCEEVPQSQGREQSLEPSVQGLPPTPAAPQLWSRRLLVGLRTSHTLRLRLQCTSDALRCSRRRAGPAQGRRRGGWGKQRSVAQILLGLKPGGGPS